MRVNSCLLFSFLFYSLTITFVHLFICKLTSAYSNLTTSLFLSRSVMIFLCCSVCIPTLIFSISFKHAHCVVLAPHSETWESLFAFVWPLHSPRRTAEPVHWIMISVYANNHNKETGFMNTKKHRHVFR